MVILDTQRGDCDLKLRSTSQIMNAYVRTYPHPEHRGLTPAQCTF